jgi:endonuclease G
MESKETRLRQLTAEIEKRDSRLAEELAEVRKKSMDNGEMTEGVPEVAIATDTLETIVLRVGRPVLTVLRNEAQLVFSDTESEVWKERLTNVRDELLLSIPSVGRIEVQNHPSMDWLGTGWLIDREIVVTNRHVAEIFGRQSGNEFIFRQGLNGHPIGASIDLLEEVGRPGEEFTFKLKKILHIEPEPGPDIAFLAIDPIGTGPLPDPVLLLPQLINSNSDVAVIGYPARDSRIPDQQLMDSIFGDVYDKKRLAPGRVTQTTADRLFHDCSTLGGCSGGAVIDLQSGKAAGLHFAGRFLESNFAVPSVILADRLEKLKKKPTNGISMVSANHNGSNGSNGSGASSDAKTAAAQSKSAPVSGDNSFTVPLQINFSFGKASLNTPAATITLAISPALAAKYDEDNEEFEEELKPEDFKDREGYIASFLGEGFEVPLPEVVSERRKNDILSFKSGSKTEHVLRYEHFSVVMCKSRRLCFFSAVNINGKVSKKSPRVGWQFDPRIPKEAQIMKECYGSAPKFSRGHMTRREDPVWGSANAALKGNADSMCVTNTTPQMQSFNAPIWLALENYALDHARDDKMRISVFTGPVMRSNDPVLFGVKIPILFWKVIAFVHDETGKLCATGYKMSQQDQLPEEEFVFGKFQTAQTSIASIEKMTGLSFGNLGDFDAMTTANEAPTGPLMDLEQIRFI